MITGAWHACPPNAVKGGGRPISQRAAVCTRGPLGGSMALCKKQWGRPNRAGKQFPPPKKKQKTERKKRCKPCVDPQTAASPTAGEGSPGLFRNQLPRPQGTGKQESDPGVRVRTSPPPHAPPLPRTPKCNSTLKSGGSKGPRASNHDPHPGVPNHFHEKKNN